MQDTDTTHAASSRTPLRTVALGLLLTLTAAILVPLLPAPPALAAAPAAGEGCWRNVGTTSPSSTPVTSCTQGTSAGTGPELTLGGNTVTITDAGTVGEPGSIYTTTSGDPAPYGQALCLDGYATGPTNPLVNVVDGTTFRNKTFTCTDALTGLVVQSDASASPTYYVYLLAVPVPEPCAWSSPTACDGPMGTGETVETMPGADAESLARCTGGSTKPHCLGWASTHWYTWDHDGEERPHPDLTGPVPKRWTFYVEDYGWNLTPLGAETYTVGWTCARQGPLYGEASRHEGWASWRGGQTRKFDVGVCDAPGTYLWNFYVLREQVPGIADYDKVELFWGYGRPGATIPTHQVSGPATSCVGGCSTTVLPGPAPTSTPAPTTVAPDDDTDEPVVGPVAGSGCDFGITDPSSWLCGLTGLFKRLLDVVGAILSWLGRLGGLLMDLLVPDLQTLQDSFAEVDTAWDASGPGQLTGGVTDIAAPVLTMDENMPTTCEGPQFTLPLPQSRSFSMNPLSTCGELTQYILGVVYPLETALIYLGGFFLGLRIVTRPFGMETPGTSQAAAA